MHVHVCRCMYNNSTCTLCMYVGVGTIIPQRGRLESIPQEWHSMGSLDIGGRGGTTRSCATLFAESAG